MDTSQDQPTEHQSDTVNEEKTIYSVPPSLSFGEQDENGIDISLLRANLLLTPPERLKKMLRAARSLQYLKNGIRK